MGVSGVTYISKGIFRVNFTNPERFGSGAYVGLVQQEVGGVPGGYGTHRVHGNASDGSPLAIGASGSCDIHHMGFANQANLATQPQDYTDSSNTFKVRTNAAFFCLRSDSDTRKPAVANFFTGSENFTAFWTQPGSPASLTAVNEFNPFGATTGVFRFNGSTYANAFFSQGRGSIGVTYTFSIFAKVITGATLTLLCGGGGNNFGTAFNIGGTGAGKTAAIGTGVSPASPAGQSSSNAKITRLGNGWNRISMAFNPANSPAPLVQSAFDQNNFLVFGAQLEEGTAVTPYIKTEGISPVYGNQDALISFSPGASGLGQRSFQNLYTHSQNFTDASWTKGRLGVSAGGYVAPDGTTTAMKLMEVDPVGNAPYYKYINKSDRIDGSTAPTSWTLSVYAKSAERKHLAFTDISYGSMGRVVVDLENGTVTETTPATITGRSVGTPIIENAGNGWWRVAVSFKNIAPPTNAIAPGFAPNNGATMGMLGEGAGVFGPSYAGVSGSGILIWGAQLERGTVLSPYTRTTTSTVGTVFTRVAGLTYQSTPSQLRSRREATAWGTIVIPPNKGTIGSSSNVSAYLEGASGVKKVVARDNSHFDVYFTDKMDVETYCVILGTEQETVNLPESTTVGAVNSIPPTDEFTLDTIQNSMSSTTDIQRQVGMFTITSRRQSPGAAWTPRSVHYQLGRTQRINFMVFGGRTTNGTQ